MSPAASLSFLPLAATAVCIESGLLSAFVGVRRSLPIGFDRVA